MFIQIANCYPCWYIHFIQLLLCWNIPQCENFLRRRRIRVVSSQVGTAEITASIILSRKIKFQYFCRIDRNSVHSSPERSVRDVASRSAITEYSITQNQNRILTEVKYPMLLLCTCWEILGNCGTHPEWQRREYWKKCRGLFCDTIPESIGHFQSGHSCKL